MGEGKKDILASTKVSRLGLVCLDLRQGQQQLVFLALPPLLGEICHCCPRLPSQCVTAVHSSALPTRQAAPPARDAGAGGTCASPGLPLQGSLLMGGGLSFLDYCMELQLTYHGIQSFIVRK